MHLSKNPHQSIHLNLLEGKIEKVLKALPDQSDLNLPLLGKTLFFIACEDNRIEVVKTLLEFSLDVNHHYKGKTPFFVAAAKGHFDVLHLIADVPGLDTNRCLDDGSTPLFAVCRSGCIETLKVLMNCSLMNVNKRRNDGSSPLLVACEKNRPSVVSVLLESPKVDLNNARDDGTTPLILACQLPNPAIAKMLLSLGDRVNLKAKRCDGATAFFLACSRGNAEIVQMLLPLLNKEDLNDPIDDNSTPFLAACQNWDPTVAEILADDPRIDFNQMNMENLSPFYVCCQKGHVKVVKALLSKPGLVTKCSKARNLSPCGIALKNGHINVLEALLADSEALSAFENKDDLFYLAAEKGSLAIVTALIQDPTVNADYMKPNGATPLYTAALHGHIEIVKQLLSSFSCLNTSAICENKTPEEAAKNKNFKEIAQMISEYDQNGKIPNQIKQNISFENKENVWVISNNFDIGLKKRESLIKRFQKSEVRIINERITKEDLQLIKTLMGSTNLNSLWFPSTSSSFPPFFLLEANLTLLFQKQGSIQI